MPCPAPPAGRARINIQVVGGALTYTTINGASEPTPGKHRVPKNTEVEWCCDAGPVAIHFYEGDLTKLFNSGNKVIQSAAAGTPTAFEITRNNVSRKQFKYSVSVAVGGQLFFQDPDFETGGGGGGDGSGTAASVKSAKKPPKKKKKR